MNSAQMPQSSTETGPSHRQLPARQPPPTARSYCPSGQRTTPRELRVVLGVAAFANIVTNYSAFIKGRLGKH